MSATDLIIVTPNPDVSVETLLGPSADIAAVRVSPTRWPPPVGINPAATYRFGRDPTAAQATAWQAAAAAEAASEFLARNPGTPLPADGALVPLGAGPPPALLPIAGAPPAAAPLGAAPVGALAPPVAGGMVPMAVGNGQVAPVVAPIAAGPQLKARRGSLLGSRRRPRTMGPMHWRGCPMEVPSLGALARHRPTGAGPRRRRSRACRSEPRSRLAHATA